MLNSKWSELGYSNLKTCHVNDKSTYMSLSENAVVTVSVLANNSQLEDVVNDNS